MKLSYLKGISNINAPIAMDKLHNLEVRLGRKFPPAYRDILQTADGFALENGILFYSSEDVLERNETFEVNKYAPGYLAIGDDSGGRAFLIPFDGVGVYLVEQGSMDPDEMAMVGHSLPEWINMGCPT